MIMFNIINILMLSGFEILILYHLNFAKILKTIFVFILKIRNGRMKETVRGDFFRYETVTTA